MEDSYFETSKWLVLSKFFTANERFPFVFFYFFELG
jgi:hypothetical protein